MKEPGTGRYIVPPSSWPPTSLCILQNTNCRKIIVIIGYTCTGIQVAALPSISSTYSIDSYKPVAGSIFVSITVNKNVWGYGFSKFITPWITKDGYIPPIMTNMALVLLWCCSGIIFWFYGKKFRGWTKNSKVHQMWIFEGEYAPPLYTVRYDTVEIWKFLSTALRILSRNLPQYLTSRYCASDEINGFLKET